MTFNQEGADRTMKPRILAISSTFLFGLFTLTAFAQEATQPVRGFKVADTRSDLRSRIETGTELFEDDASGVETWADAPLAVEALGGFNELLPFVTPSPDQEEAGTCLYMSVTGVAEWWLQKLKTPAGQTPSVLPDGNLDLSERHLIHMASDQTQNQSVANWKTDTSLLFNTKRMALKNKALRFTKGWWAEDNDGDYIEAAAGTPGASYGPEFNWITPRLTNVPATDYVALPRFERKVLFADPESNQWNVGIAPKNIVETVKTALRTEKAPVQVLYNHLGYWHSVYVAGFNDETTTRGCPFVDSYRTHLGREITNLQNQHDNAQDEAARKRFAKKLAAKRRMQTQIESRITDAGGCKSKGVFYVRDSIYSDRSEPVYDYDLTNRGEERNYSKRIILREYDWLRFLSNHVIVIKASQAK